MTRRWEFTADPQSIVRTYTAYEQPAPVDELRRDLSLCMHHSFIENKEGLERLAILFQIASVLLAVEVVLWIAAIASTG